MVPLNNNAPGTLRFGLPPVVRHAGLLLALLGTSSAVAVSFVPGIATGLGRILFVGSAVMSLAGWGIALLDRSVVLDLAGRRFRHYRGFGIWHRERAGSLDAFDRFEIRCRRRFNLYGEPETRVGLSLAGPNGSLRLCDGLLDGRGRALAAELGERLAMSVAECAFVEKQTRMTKIVRLGVAAAPFVGMAAVFAAAIWPAIGHSNFERRGAGQYPASVRSFDAGQSRYIEHDYIGAESEFRKALEFRPMWPQANNMLAYALADQGKLDAALETAIKAMNQGPNEGYIIDTVAEMYQRRREWKRAAEYYELALQHEYRSEAAETNVKYAETLLVLGRREEAIRHLRLAEASLIPPWSPRAAKMLEALDRKKTTGGRQKPAAGTERAIIRQGKTVQ